MIEYAYVFIIYSCFGKGLHILKVIHRIKKKNVVLLIYIVIS